MSDIASLWGRARYAMAYPASGGALIADARIVAVDLETTGLGESDSIVEIAVAEIPPRGGITHLITTRVNPCCPIPPEATAIHGISDQDVVDAPAFFEIAPMVAEALGRGGVVCGYNIIGFDWPFLERELRGAGVTPPGVTLIDPLIFARWHWSARSNRLVDLCEDLGIPMAGDAHDARVDIDATLQALIGMVTRGLIPPVVAAAVHAQDAITALLAAVWGAFGPFFAVDFTTGMIIHWSRSRRGEPVVGTDPGFMRWLGSKEGIPSGAREVCRRFFAQEPLLVA